MIRPVSIAQSAPKFKGYTEIGGKNKSNEKEFTSSEKEKLALKNGLMAGFFFGTILSTTGTFIYKDTQIDKMLKDIASEQAYEDVDSFKIEDKTQDEIPEFILIDKNGDETVYDFTTGKIYFNEDGELIEKD